MVSDLGHHRLVLPVTTPREQDPPAVPPVATGLLGGLRGTPTSLAALRRLALEQALVERLVGGQFPRRPFLGRGLPRLDGRLLTTSGWHSFREQARVEGVLGSGSSGSSRSHGGLTGGRGNSLSRSFTTLAGLHLLSDAVHLGGVVGTHGLHVAVLQVVLRRTWHRRSHGNLTRYGGGVEPLDVDGVVTEEPRRAVGTLDDEAALA
jgi:hypothetical protein